MSEPVTGTSSIREALRVRNRKVNLGTMARDLGLATSTLEDFAEGRSQDFVARRYAAADHRLHLEQRHHARYRARFPGEWRRRRQDPLGTAPRQIYS